MIHSCIQQILTEDLHTCQAQYQSKKYYNEKICDSCSCKVSSQDRKMDNQTSSKRKYGQRYDKVKGAAVCAKYLVLTECLRCTRNCILRFTTCRHHGNPGKGDNPTISILQMSILKHRKLWEFVQSHKKLPF